MNIYKLNKVRDHCTEWSTIASMAAKDLLQVRSSQLKRLRACLVPFLQHLLQVAIRGEKAYLILNGIDFGGSVQLTSHTVQFESAQGSQHISSQVSIYLGPGSLFAILLSLPSRSTSWKIQANQFETYSTSLSASWCCHLSSKQSCHFGRMQVLT